MPGPCAVCSPEHSALLGAWGGFLGRIAELGGPEPADYDLLSEWFRGVAGAVREQIVSRAEVDELLECAGPAISSRATMQGLVRAQPYGYPGDFEMIDRIYTGFICSDPALAKWDRFFHAQPAIRALCNTRFHFGAWLAKAEASRDAFLPRLQLLHLGGGPGRELLEYFVESPGSRVVGTCMDADARAIAYASRICEPVGGRLRFRQASPLGFQPTAMPDLIWACGLFDYLDDPNLLCVLRRLWHLLAPGGELVSGSFSRSNPSRTYLDLLGWRLYHRDALELVLLAQQAGVPEEAIRVKADPESVYLFLHLEKRA